MSAVLRSHSETWSQLQQGSDRCTAGAWHLAQDVMQQTVHLQHWPGIHRASTAVGPGELFLTSVHMSSRAQQLQYRVSKSYAISVQT